MRRHRSNNANPVREVRLVRLANLLQRGRSISRQQLEEMLEVSRATLTRDIAVLRDQLNMPIAFDRDNNGYVLVQDPVRGPRYELPGLWISDTQFHALLALINMLASVDPGLFDEFVNPVRRFAKERASLPTDRMPPPTDKLAIELGEPSFHEREIIGSIAQALYRDLQVDLYLRGADGDPVRCTPLRFALTHKGWYVDTYREGDEIVMRYAIKAIEGAEPSKVAAKRLKWGAPNWYDGPRRYPVRVIDKCIPS